MTRAPASDAPTAAPRPAGPPPTTSTSVSPASVARRGGRSTPAPLSGRFSEGTLLLLSGEKLDGEAVGLLRPLLQRRQRLGDARAHRAAAVPGFVEVRDQPARVDQVERRRGQLERFEKAADLPRIRKRDERRALDGGEDQEMQPHAEREVELAHQGQQLRRGVLALE